MAHYAQLNDKNYVINVIVVDDKYEDNLNFLTDTFGANTRWVKTSYNTRNGSYLDGTKEPLRKNYAGIGFYYDARRDAFIPPKPYSSWVLNEETCSWEPPIPYPENSEFEYDWFELGKRWVKSEL